MSPISINVTNIAGERLAHWSLAESVIFDYQNVSVIDGIYNCFNINTLIVLSVTNFKGQRSWIVYKSRKFNVIRMLSQYFDDPTRFREMQRTTGLVIVGQAALHYFARASVTTARIDIVIDPIHARCVAHHLLCTEGYSVWDGNKLVVETTWLDSKVQHIVTALGVPTGKHFSHRLREAKARCTQDTRLEPRDVTIKKLFFEKANTHDTILFVHL